MASINLTEQIILEMIDEDLVTADNWDGTDEVRSWVADGIDELCAFGKFYRRLITVPLRGGAPIYQFSPTRDVVISVRTMWLRNQGRMLECIDFSKLIRRDPRWLRTRGSPWEYFVLDFTKFGVYPCYADDQDIVEVDAIMFPEPYVGDEGPVEVRSDYMDALTSYCKSMLYMRLPGRVDDAMKQYKEFLGLSSGSRKFMQDIDKVRIKRKLGIDE